MVKGFAIPRFVEDENIFMVKFPKSIGLIFEGLACFFGVQRC